MTFMTTRIVTAGSTLIKPQIHDQKEIEMMTADLVQRPASSHPEQLRVGIDLSVNGRTDYLRGDPIT